MSGKTKSPLLSSLLYTDGDEKVKQKVEEELQVPDPTPEEAGAAIAANVVGTDTDK